MARSFTDLEFEAFFDDKPGWITLSSIDKDGYPHSVPLGFFRHGEQIVMGVRDHSRKVRNIEANPKVCVMLESGSTKGDIQGAMIQGDAVVYRDGEAVLKYMRAAASKRGTAEADLPTKPRPGAAYIVVTPSKRISWTPE